MCAREVELNRRLCRDVYLGVVAVREANGGFTLAADTGRVIDWAVCMRRLPADRMLDRLLAARAVTPAEIAAIGRRLAAFHAAAPVARPDPATVWRNWEETLAELAPYVGRTLDAGALAALGAYAREIRAAEEPRLARRVAAGRVRDGHGDARAENICLAGGEPLIFDCIEFNDRFRCVDVASEVSFLAMDLDWWERPDLRAVYVDAYTEASGDAEVRDLLPGFQCYRAVVRGLVESLRLDDRGFEPPAREAAAERARRYFALALRYAGGGTTRTLIVVSGLSGTGKTTLARALVDRLGWRLFSSDPVRKELAGVAPDERRRGALDEGLYAPEVRRRTYAALRERAEAELAAGRSVVLDATFLDAEESEAARRLAARHGARFVLVECTAPPEVVRERLAARARDRHEVSDADWEIHLAQRSRAAAMPAAPDRVVIDTTSSLEEQLARVLRALGH
jgi:hypothetical protein